MQQLSSYLLVFMTCSNNNEIILLCVRRKTMSRLCLLIELIVLFVPALAWKFKILGLDEDQIIITRIAVYGMRAFLAIPRVYNEQPYTLVEVPWPEKSFYTIYSPKPFPSGQAQVCRLLPFFFFFFFGTDLIMRFLLA